MNDKVQKPLLGKINFGVVHTHVFQESLRSSSRLCFCLARLSPLFFFCRISLLSERLLCEKLKIPRPSQNKSDTHA